LPPAENTSNQTIKHPASGSPEYLWWHDAQTGILTINEVEKTAFNRD